MSSTARSLSEQARELQGLVARFKLQQNSESAPAAKMDVTAADSRPARTAATAKKRPAKADLRSYPTNGAAARPAAKGQKSPESGFEEF
jgi:hypothetical protein